MNIDLVLPYFDVISINQYYGWFQGNAEGFRTMLDKFMTVRMLLVLATARLL